MPSSTAILSSLSSATPEDVTLLIMAALRRMRAAGASTDGQNPADFYAPNVISILEPVFYPSAAEMPQDLPLSEGPMAASGAHSLTWLLGGVSVLVAFLCCATVSCMFRACVRAHLEDSEEESIYDKAAAILATDRADPIKSTAFESSGFGVCPATGNPQKTMDEAEPRRPMPSPASHEANSPTSREASVSPSKRAPAFSPVERRRPSPLPLERSSGSNSTSREASATPARRTPSSPLQPHKSQPGISAFEFKSALHKLGAAEVSSAGFSSPSASPSEALREAVARQALAQVDSRSNPSSPSGSGLLTPPHRRAASSSPARRGSPSCSPRRRRQPSPVSSRDIFSRLKSPGTPGDRSRGSPGSPWSGWRAPQENTSQRVQGHIERVERVRVARRACSFDAPVSRDGGAGLEQHLQAASFEAPSSGGPSPVSKVRVTLLPHNAEPWWARSGEGAAPGQAPPPGARRQAEGSSTQNVQWETDNEIPWEAPRRMRFDSTVPVGDAAHASVATESTLADNRNREHLQVKRFDPPLRPTASWRQTREGSWGGRQASSPRASSPSRGRGRARGRCGSSPAVGGVLLL
jgi:hypothetical protein